MRVLLISRCPPYPLYLGDRLILWHLARELQASGVQVDLIAYTQQAQDHQETASYAHLFGSIQLLPETPRSVLSYLWRALMPSSRFPTQPEQSWSPQMWQAVEQALTQNRYDVLHLFGGVHLYELAHLTTRFPAIITPYESYSLYLRRVVARSGSLLDRLRLWMARQYESWMFNPYARSVVLTEEDRAELLRLNPHLPVVVIPNGIDLEQFQQHEQQRDPHTLLFVGNYEYPPNREAALVLVDQILPAVRRVFPDVRLQLVGNAPPPELLALRSDHVEVTGRVPDVRPYLQQATIFVCPLLTGAGIKNKVLEALAMGIPIVASPLSVDGIHVRDGVQVRVAEPASIAAAVVELLRDPALRQQMSMAGRAVIEADYSWQHVARQYAQLYEQVQRDFHALATSSAAS